MKRTILFIKLLVSDSLDAAKIALIIVIAISLVVSAGIGILYGIGYVSSVYILGLTSNSFEDITFSGMATIYFIAVPGFVIFLVIKGVIALFRWIAWNWSVSRNL